MEFDNIVKTHLVTDLLHIVQHAMRMTDDQLDQLTEGQLKDILSVGRIGPVMDALARKEKGRPLVTQEAIDLYTKYNSDTMAKFYGPGEVVGSSQHRYTVKDLKEHLKDLPDDMVVTHQRIEDIYFKTGGWRTVLAAFEKWPGEVAHLSEYLVAFSGNVTETKDGDKIFVINSHY